MNLTWSSIEIPNKQEVKMAAIQATGGPEHHVGV